MNSYIVKATEIIKEDYLPDRIILFGSYAKGLEKNRSDIDLLIIKPSILKRQHRGSEIKEILNKFTIKFDLLFYTPEEFESELNKPYSFLNSICKSWKNLYKKSCS